MMLRNRLLVLFTCFDQYLYHTIHLQWTLIIIDILYIQSLLRGPVQAVGTGQGINQGAMYQGMSGGGGGLDDDEDEFNRQLQQAQRQSQIEDQQNRERQARADRERREREEMQQQAELQEAQSRNQQQAQSGGGRLGGSAAKPQDKDDLRARRLKFLEDQEKKAQQQGDDQ